jgi:hypothetical protein
MNNIKRVHLFEIMLYATVLLVVLCVPIFNGILDYREWSGVLKNWVRILPFVLVFTINNFLLVPKLLFLEKYLYYTLSCIVLIVMVVYFSGFIFDFTTPMRPPFNGVVPPNLPNFPNFPPRRPIFFHFGQAIVSFLLIGFNTGVKSSVRWSEERVQQAERERQHLHTELAFLKYQISPHFLMNTLNNIHALIDIDTDKAKDAIVKLSLLMRYLLYETDVQNVSLKKEIEFIKSYIELMRLRYDEDILTVKVEYSTLTENIIVPSFLFLSFIENAFKHGVDTHTVSLIHIRFVHENGRLVFTAGNSKLGVASAITDSSGIGLENVRKRLDLIYKEDYTLEIHSTENTYIIYLSIPI